MRRLLIALPLAALALGAPGAARAQGMPTVTVPQAVSIIRHTPDGKEVTKRDSANFPDDISLSDCQRDIRLSITLTTTGYTDSSQHLQAWASSNGADCSDYNLRNTGSSTRRCARILPQDIPREANPTVEIPLRNVLATANVSQSSPEYTAGTAALCGTIDSTPFTIYFLWLGGSGQVTNGSGKLDLNADTVGPEPLADVSATAGDTRIKVTWTNLSAEGGTSGATNVVIYYAPQKPRNIVSDGGATCTDAGTSTSTADASDDSSTTTTSDASTSSCTTGTSSTSVVQCTADGFSTTGSTPPDESVAGVQKVQVAAGSTSYTLEGLTNGTGYAVTVAATDQYLNAGQVSTTTCVTPEVLDDFFEYYRGKGGQAGGGFCSLDAQNANGQAAFASLCASAVAVSAIARRRRKQNKPNKQGPAV